MAGDWLKMEIATPDKAEVLGITAAMKWDDPDLTVGKLFRAWRWFDQQTIDGNAAGVTPALLDRIVGAVGFAEAMHHAGWLTITEAGISLPNFDRHNGATAKERALTARRVKKLREATEQPPPAGRNGDSVTSTVTPSVTRAATSASPREDKREEKKRDDEHPPVAPPQASPLQQAIAMILDAFPETLRPHAGLAARWIEQIQEGTSNLDPIAAAETVREIVWKYPNNGAEYIGKCVGTAATKARAGEGSAATTKGHHERTGTGDRARRTGSSGTPPAASKLGRFKPRDGRDV